MAPGIITRLMQLASGVTVQVRMWANDTVTPSAVVPVGMSLDASGAIISPATEPTAAATRSATEALLGQAQSNLRLFRPVDGANDAFTDAEAAEIGPLAAGRVWLKLTGGDGHIAIGEAPEPTTSSSPPLAEGGDYYFEVDAGDTIAVIGAPGASGTLHISTETAVPA